MLQPYFGDTPHRTIFRNRFRPNRVLQRMALLNSHLFIFCFGFLRMAALSVGLICATGCGIRLPIGEVTVDTLFILVCTISRNRFRPNRVLRRMALLNSHLQWGLRFKRAEFKRIAGLREVKTAWHTPLLNRTTLLLNQTYTQPPPPIVAQLKT